MNQFVGIGMGAVQAGVYLPRAQEAGLRKTVIVRRRELAEFISAAGRITVNIADGNSLKTLEINGIEAVLLSDPECVNRLSAASHVAVAVSSVADYPSIAPLLAQAMRQKETQKGPRCTVYASENHLQAASLLEESISTKDRSDTVRVVDTVIGRMSRTVSDPAEITGLGLVPGAVDLRRSWLTEEFDRIFISKADAVSEWIKPLPRLTELNDLRPLQDAKLHGHNAAHAALAFAGMRLRLDRISEVLANRTAAEFIRDAMIKETGAALAEHHHGTDPLFTEPGWTAHTDGLLRRMENPRLRDLCSRVGRDVRRKLGWRDRLVGTVRMIEAAGQAADRWRAVILCACDACGLSQRDIRSVWNSEGARPGEIDDMLIGLERVKPLYHAWIQDSEAAGENF